MTQEILGCLLIKSKFIIMSAEEIIDQVCDKSLVVTYFKIIHQIMKNDHFFFTNDEFLEKLEYFIYKKRFSEKYDKDTISIINEIICNINIFRGMNEHDQQTIRMDWLCEEVVLRELPITKYRSYNMADIYNLMVHDYLFIDTLVNNQDNNIEIYNPICCLSTINLMCNKYIQIYQENPQFLLICLYITNTFKKPSFNLTYSKMARQASRNLNELKDEIEMPKELINKKLKLILKKDEK